MGNINDNSQHFAVLPGQFPQFGGGIGNCVSLFAMIQELVLFSHRQYLKFIVLGYLLVWLLLLQGFTAFFLHVLRGENL